MINPRYLQTTVLARLRKRYAANKPFPHAQLKDFFDVKQLRKVKHALLNERFVEAEADLFSFQQCDDLKHSKNRTLREFRSFLRSPRFLSLLSYITGENLSATIDISGFIYDDTDHLLPHDDKLEGRKLAFVLNLSTMTAKDGGQLDLFKGNNVAKSYLPAFNSLVVFTVKPGTTMHQVREVLTDEKRITLAGWIHGNERSRVHENRRSE
ncbi:2OG-Fe(II) oxygenase [Candidatus Woesearchaeota archaeon]|nr:2OG-Fe(II) oxygenase [Candidatus Woesearchaeota archaeon]